MSKLRKRLSKWFLDTAKKLDKETVNGEMFVPPVSPRQTLIVYDQYHIDKIRGQYSISSIEEMRMQNIGGFNLENEIYYRIAQGITEEIMKNYSENIEVQYKADMDTKIYSLDLYVCKPQKKERL